MNLYHAWRHIDTNFYSMWRRRLVDLDSAWLREFIISITTEHGYMLGGTFVILCSVAL